jgi:hypothetical protein
MVIYFWEDWDIKKIVKQIRGHLEDIDIKINRFEIKSI